MSTVDEQQFPHQMKRLEALINQAEGFADPAAQSVVRDIVRLLLEIHGAGLAKMLELIARAGGPGQTIVEACTANALLGSLLLLHDLHPLDLRTRVQQALEKAHPFLRAHGGSVELLSVEDGVVQLRMQGSCESCPSSEVTLRTTIEEAILGTSPDVVRIEVSKIEEVACKSLPGPVSVPRVMASARTRMSLPVLGS
jgi:Fe-S cluster biogenesis protein NfuA